MPSTSWAYISSVYPLFSERLEAIDGHYILCDQIIIHCDSFVNTPKEVSPLILVTYVLYHATSLKVLPTDLLMLTARQQELRMWSEESLYELVANTEAIWISLRQFLQGSGLRFLQLILGCHYGKVQNKV